MNSYNESKEIVELDLDPIKVKLTHKESGEGWTLDQASAVESEYRRFLYLMKEFPNEMAAPSMDVDTFWHYHILDTMKYARDCDEVFGYFLHHFPYVGLRGADDLEAHEQMGDRMAVLYEQTFGEKYPDSLISDADSTVLASAAYSSRPTAETAYSSRPTAMTAYSSRPTAATAYSSRPTAATAYSSRPTAMTAYSSRPTAATAYSSRPTAMTAYSSRPTAATAYSSRPTATTAYSSRPMGMAANKQDKTESSSLGKRPESAMDLARTAANDEIVLNKFFITRPQLPARV